MQPFDEGTIFLKGKEYKPSSPLEANTNKVAMVVQELGVITSMTGAMNIFMGKTEQFKSGGFINTKKMVQAARDIFKKWEISEVPLDIPCADLTMEQRKLIELARALYSDPDLLILDEITQSLSQDTREVVYRLINRFKKENRSMIIISHDIDETLKISDSITVLRDGEVVATVDRCEIDIDSLKQMMVGRKIEGDYYRTDSKADYKQEVLLKVQNLTLANGQIKNISFDLHKGEILAVCGLSDAGIHTLGSCVFGIYDSHRSGTVTDMKSGKVLQKPQDMIRCGGAYLSKNRDEEGLMLQDSIRNNMYLPSAENLAGFMGYTKTSEIDSLARKAYDEFDVKATGIQQPIGRLSGGNKQKINLGRWMTKKLNYMILDCPTRGVDIGVKAYIYNILRERRKNGLGCLLITDELAEAIGTADRIIIMKEGEEAGLIERGVDFTESKIIGVML